MIGVVTSPTGAVIRDIIHRVSDRFPRRIIVWPVRVQGEGAAEEVAAAIQGFNALKVGGAIPRPDGLIVARGGGSLEDLWAFNEEVVVRAAAASAIPLIAAVGHETDWTLIDYAADRRAPTPTAAAELAVPVRIDLVADLQQRAMRLLQSIGRTLSDLKIRLDGLVRGIPRLDAVVAEKEQALDGLVERLKLGPRALLQAKGQDLNVLSAGLNLTRLRRDIERHVLDLKQFHSRLSRASARAFSDASNELAALAARIESVSPQRVLERGYAMVLGPDGPITSVKNALAGSKVDVRFADGQVAAQIGAMGSDSATPHKRKTPAGGNQGSLF